LILQHHRVLSTHKAYPYHTYGAAAWYNPATGFYGRGAVAYGPYGGYGRAAA